MYKVSCYIAKVGERSCVWHFMLVGCEAACGATGCPTTSHRLGKGVGAVSWQAVQVAHLEARRVSCEARLLACGRQNTTLPGPSQHRLQPMPCLIPHSLTGHAREPARDVPERQAHHALAQVRRADRFATLGAGAGKTRCTWGMLPRRALHGCRGRNTAKAKAVPRGGIV